MTGRLAKAAAFRRRHNVKLTILLLQFGLPATVAILKGGVVSSGFWWVTFLWMPFVLVVVFLLGMVLRLVFSLIFLVVDRILKRPEEDFFPAKPNPGTPLRRYRNSDEPAEEFWSDQMVEGWRSWRWDGQRLEGFYARWETDTYVATCERCARVPGWGDWCGINAVKRIVDVHRFPSYAGVVGTVEMWGDVIEHDYGYRASHARMTELWAESRLLASNLEHAYPGVPVHVGRPSRQNEEN